MFLELPDLAAGLPAGHWSGGIITDRLGDSQRRLVLISPSLGIRAYTWNGTRWEPNTPLTEPRFLGVNVVAADFDGDGSEELYVSGGGQPDRLLKWSVTGEGWQDLFRWARIRAGSSFQAVPHDRRGNGRHGFLTLQLSGSTSFQEHFPDGTPVDVVHSLFQDDPPMDGRAAWMGPLSHHRGEIVIARRGNNHWYRASSPGRYRELADTPAVADGANTTSHLVVLDADEDGRLDLVLGSETGPHRMLVQTATGFRDVASPALAFPSRIGRLLAADLLNQGREQILFLHPNEASRFFYPEAKDEWSRGDPGALTDCRVALAGAVVIADFNHDGVLEVLLQDVEKGAWRVFVARGAEERNWLQVRPRTRFGAPAVGTLVRVETARQQFVQLCGVGRSEAACHFGLTPGIHVERVRVVWPDGASRTLAHPVLNQELVLTYPLGE
jgi:hypothetical protein